MSHPATAAPAASTGGAKGMVGCGFILLAILLAILFAYFAREEKPTIPPANTKVSARTSPTTTATEAVPSYLSLTTPVTLTADYLFHIESNGRKIKITYSNGESFIYEAKGLQKFPQPPRGPKTFEDPCDPKGHIAFRIYPIK